jgi:hypothetical protein
MLHKHLGVRFLYEAKVPFGEETSGEKSSREEQQSTLEQVLTPESLATLPAEWLATLEHGAKETNTTLLLKVIEQIRPQNATIARVLADLTNDFEYDTILAVLHQAGERTRE